MALSKVDVESGGTGLVAAGTSGNVLTSDGTDWTSAAGLPAAGSDGNILTSDGTNWASEAPAAGGGAWNVITSTNITSSVVTVDFTSGIDSTYDQYCFVVSNLRTSDAGTDLDIRIKDTGDSSFRSDSQYQYYLNRQDSGGSSSVGSSNVVNMMLIADTCDAVSVRLWLPDPSDTSSKKFISWEGSHAEGTNAGVSQGVGSYKGNTNAITGVQFLLKSGSHTMDSGRITMYGLSHA